VSALTDLSINKFSHCTLLLACELVCEKFLDWVLSFFDAQFCFEQLD
jgi:hypothetical protein